MPTREKVAQPTHRESDILKKVLLSIAGITTALLLFLTPSLKFPGIDTTADTYFTQAITKGGLSYATCRVINASVSII
ncbi:MAG: hypothetical protein D3923_02645, partial [Candidatus Electrothrix sp. AR3]|nr:hypothetical protein [Candidatus Electrothrix sp. AR3]